MTILCFDLETTGLPATKGFGRFFDYKDTGKYDSSRIVSFCFLLNTTINKISNIVYPDNFIIANPHIHGITQEKAVKEGVRWVDVIDKIKDYIQQASILVGHNVDFDINVLSSELYRRGYPELAKEVFEKPRQCTMKMGKLITKLPGFRGDFKYPKLLELYKHLFQEELEGAHSAYFDTLNTFKIYNKIKELKLYPL